jgi:hypothetical protein
MGEKPTDEDSPAGTEEPADVNAKDDSTVDGKERDALERLEAKDRAVRRRVLVTVTPVVLSLFIPWEDGFAWEMNERVDGSAFIAVPLVALVATFVALFKKRSLLVRTLLLGGLGLAFAWTFHDLITSSRVIRAMSYDFKRLDAYALYAVLGVPLFAFTGELFAALDRRSRPRAIVAGLGWATLALGYFLPLRSDRIESMPFLAITEAVDDAGRDPENFLFIIPAMTLFFIAVGAATLTILRLIGDAEQRERWRPRSGCLAIGLGSIPAFLSLAVFTFVAISDDVEWLGTAIDGTTWALLFFLGVPGLLAAGLDGAATTVLLAFGRGERSHVRLARLGVGAVAGLGILSCLTPVAVDFLPDGRDDAAGEVLLEVAGEVLHTAGGTDLDPRFIGGYSEFDLRASRGVLRTSGEGPLELVYATFEILVSGHHDATILVGVDPDGELHYLSAESTLDTYPPRGMLRRASDRLADLVARIDEGLSTVTCLPASSPPDLPGLSADPSSFTRVCSPVATGDDRRRISDIPGSDAAHGTTGTYTVWIRAGGEMHVLEGRLYSHEGRLWIGKATPAGEAAPSSVP